MLKNVTYTLLVPPKYSNSIGFQNPTIYLNIKKLSVNKSTHLIYKLNLIVSLICSKHDLAKKKGKV